MCVCVFLCVGVCVWVCKGQVMPVGCDRMSVDILFTIQKPLVPIICSFGEGCGLDVQHVPDIVQICCRL